MAYISESNGTGIKRYWPVPGAGLVAGIIEFFELVGAAAGAAHAIEVGRQPDARDLERLGLEGVVFSLAR